MKATSRTGGVDAFRLLAAMLVIAIHTSPLASVSGEADFFLTRILARVAVPFFFMVTGQFVVSEFFIDRERAGTRLLEYLKKTGAWYAFAILLYLPLGFYAGHYKNLTVGGALRLLLFDGSFYHLWYFPACMLGVLVIYCMSRLLRLPALTAVAAVLYAVGLFGDSYYGLAVQIPALEKFYDGIFAFSSYTRNGLFFAPLFLLLGVWMRLWKKELSWSLLAAGTLGAFVCMTAEGFALHLHGMQRHDSMYACLVPVMIFGYQLLLKWPVSAAKKARRMSAWVYVLHPFVIVVVRGAAGAAHLENLFVENSLVHFLAVTAGSFASAWLLAQLHRPGAGGQRKKARAWIELDRKALEQNVNFMRACLPKDCVLMPAVKANAYGHGDVLVAREFNRLGVHAFCVASAEEGKKLRRGGIRGEILVLGYTHPSEFALLRRFRLTQTVVDTAYARQMLAAKGIMHVHIGVDTGMHRLGISAADSAKIAQLMRSRHLKVDGIYTHLATSDGASSADQIYVKKQVNAFWGLLEGLKQQGLAVPKIHMQASYGVLNYPNLAGDYARVGIALYGILSTKADTKRWEGALAPVLSLKARVASVRTLYAGESAGYGTGFTAACDMQIAALAIGYADGIPRMLSSAGGEVLIRGKRAPMIGRICMDQLLVDVSEISSVRQGDTAVLIGELGDERITASDIAEQCATITNEILSRLGGRLERIVV